MKKGTWIAVVIVIAAIVVFTAVYMGGSTLTLSFTGLEPLAQGHYEGWAIFGEEKVSTGKFNLGDSLTFKSRRDLSTADMIVVTIEADGDVDSVPSGVVILAGALSQNAASLEFPVDLSSASGSYILATPTNDPSTFEKSGVWFLKLPPPPTAGLSLPALGDGWIYEGWAVNQDTPLTTGTFSSVEGADNFNGYSEIGEAPPFPGEDYLLNAPEGITFPINLGDGASKVVVSVEPNINGVDPTGPAPFQIKPLVADVPSGAADHVNYVLSLNLDSVPSGSAIIG